MPQGYSTSPISSGSGYLACQHGGLTSMAMDLRRIYHNRIMKRMIKREHQNSPRPEFSSSY
jgi:hypothetical protein